jgi:hypothetical protein
MLQRAQQSKGIYLTMHECASLLVYFIQDLWAIPKVTKEIPKIEGETCEMPFFDFQGSILQVLSEVN